MYALYIDCSNYLKIGLLDQNLNWIDHLSDTNNISTRSLHTYIFELLQKHHIKFHQIQNLFYCSGPGSYTGNRVAEGLARTLKWLDVNIYSFYLFEVPWILSQTEGKWVAYAYKNQVFVHQWKQTNIEQKLLDVDVFFETELQDGFPIYSCELTLEWIKKKSLIDQIDWPKTEDLIYSNPEILFNYILERKLLKKPFYYRELEQEFLRPAQLCK